VSDRRRFDVRGPIEASGVPAIDRFLLRVEWSERRHAGTRCMVWKPSGGRGGYGRFSPHAGQSFSAHRWLYERWVGPIPKGLVLDHLCVNPPCVNPDHMEPVTQRDNVLRSRSHVAVNAIKTHCKRGHPFSGDNLFINSRGHRVCRTCVKESERRRAAA